MISFEVDKHQWMHMLLVNSKTNLQTLPKNDLAKDTEVYILKNKKTFQIKQMEYSILVSVIVQ